MRTIVHPTTHPTPTITLLTPTMKIHHTVLALRERTVIVRDLAIAAKMERMEKMVKMVKMERMEKMVKMVKMEKMDVWVPRVAKVTLVQSGHQVLLVLLVPQVQSGHRVDHQVLLVLLVPQVQRVNAIVIAYPFKECLCLICRMVILDPTMIIQKMDLQFLLTDFKNYCQQICQQICGEKMMAQMKLG